MGSDREAAWDQLHGAMPPVWWAGGPSHQPERQVWVLYDFWPAERPVAGRRRDEWLAVAESKEAVVREMARCLREIGEGRVPQ